MSSIDDRRMKLSVVLRLQPVVLRQHAVILRLHAVMIRIHDKYIKHILFYYRFPTSDSIH